MKEEKIKCPMKIKNVFPYGQVPVVDYDKLKKIKEKLEKKE